MKKVLIIDDDKNSRLLVKKVLQKIPNIEIFEAENGLEGLRILEKEDLSLVFLDLVMPVMNGQDFLRKITFEGYEVPVVVLTTDDENAKNITVLGAKEYMLKPVSPIKLIQTAKKYIN